MDAVSIVTLAFIAAFAVFLLYKEDLLKNGYTLAIALALVIAAFAVRAMCMDHETLDYKNFLTLWVQYYRDNGGFSALSQSVGNYNVPYLYFLVLFSRLGIRDLYLIKLLSILFDVILAWSVMKLVGLFHDGRGRRLFAFLAALFLPTVILNGSYWGQCDSIYAAFALLAIYCGISDKPVRSLIFIALAFSFKLQAIFVMPLWLVLIYTGHVKWRHLPIFPLTYCVVVLPAVIAGRPFLDTLMLYIDQAGSIGGGLNYNSPSIFAYVSGDVDTALYSKLGIIAAFLLCAVMFLWLYVRRRRVTREALLGAATVFAIGIPLLLPHMHDRYFFVADVLTLALAVVAPVCLPVPVLVSFASLLGYHAYLKQRYLLPMRDGAAALIIALVLVLAYVGANLWRRRKRAGIRD